MYTQNDNKGIELLENIEEENPKYNPGSKVSSDNRPALQQNVRSSDEMRVNFADSPAESLLHNRADGGFAENLRDVRRALSAL